MTKSEVCSFVRYSPRLRSSALRQAHNAKEMCVFFSEACYSQTPLHFDLCRTLEEGILKGDAIATLHVRTETGELQYTYPSPMRPRDVLHAYVETTTQMEKALKQDSEKTLSRSFYFHPPVQAVEQSSTYIASSLDTAVLWELHCIDGPFEKEAMVSLFAETLLDADAKFSLEDMTFRLLGQSYIPVRWDEEFATAYNKGHKNRLLKGLGIPKTPDDRLLAHLVQAEKARFVYEDRLKEVQQLRDLYDKEGEPLKKKELDFDISTLLVYCDATKLAYQRLLDVAGHMRKSLL